MIAEKDQRIGVFVDIQNLYHSAKNLYNSRVNYNELVNNIVGERKLMRAVAYVVKSEGIDGFFHGEAEKEKTSGKNRRVVSPEAAFFKALEETGFELRSKDLQVYPGGMKKADWDVGLAVDAIRMSGSLDNIILVTGDGDFVPLIEYLQWGLGKVVEVAAFGKSASSRLREAADKFISLDDIPKILLNIKRRK
ncbi:MAG: hypothetical protein COU07_03480 [Candidatus Harrisonbacteria bacterium CG10_big_fil_rev_8_21_14_0_10_40_38]|uniref:NYN domain-containing protein n=1 Tax=Candidatus Harrisonbacteria bacterium CG10_big_fil_rev_8_21_14_0_10_40_38 TaxID=1974583 RepID=A0A2H0UR61_9BACT|nr:MAG: hypothetical protein COU07_03480 [Candidatus Harrisonbacteria bacterium CG10_big_fil_rev_8_21_14_0_10_40_38]